MNRLAAVAIVVLGLSVTGQESSPQMATEETAGALSVPAGTQVHLTVTHPLWRHSAKPGDPLYLETDFPVTAQGRLAIPPGTWIRGIVLAMQPANGRGARVQLDVGLSQLILANGYVVSFAQTAGTRNTPAPTAARLALQVSRGSDLLLDNGTQFTLALAAPLVLDGVRVQEAAAISRAPQPGSFRTASLCRPTPGTPGTPGTPDTVIPGSPGTPDTVVPGGPGMPDTVIPGIPATPTRVISGGPGFPGTPGINCPPPPLVLSSVPLTNPPSPPPSPPKP